MRPPVTPIMGPLLLALVVTLALLSGCASRLPGQGDRDYTCRYVVELDVKHPAFQPNVYSSAGGGLVGAGAGAFSGLSGGVLSIFTVPIGAAIGAGYGTACAVAGSQHPNADADFERILREADADAFPRALETALNAPRAECRHVGLDVAADANPDAIVEIVKMESGMACLFGQQEYWIAVQWRTKDTRSGRVSVPANTKCTQSSFRSVDDWFAKSGDARAEIERLLARTGQRIATEILVQEPLPACAFRSRASGVVEAR